MVVVRFHRHHLAHCDCQPGEGCQICQGGLAHCTVCGGFEASLPEDCPGAHMTDEQGNMVQSGKLDYRVRHGGWTEWTREREMAAKRLVT